MTWATIDAEEAARLYQEGWSLKRLMDHYSASFYTVRDAVESQGVQIREPNAADNDRQVLPLEPDADLIQRYLRGESLREIASTIEMSQHTLRRRLKEWGVELRSPGRPKEREPKRRSKSLGLSQGEIIYRYREGESLMSLAEAAEVSHATIRNRLIEWGVYAPHRYRRSRR